MKKTLLLLVAWLLVASAADAQNVVYVKWNAPGNNDGTSWQDAYRDLQDALTNANEGDEIWIFQGAYYPGGLTPDTLSTFLIDKSLSLYGGFNGNEMSRDERNWQMNPVILSGDLARNDVPGDFFQNKTDNARHVVTVVADSTDRVTFDGITFTGGNATDNGNLPVQMYSGGAILTVSPITVNFCRFNNNFARTGGAVAVLPDSKMPCYFSNSLFEENRATSQSAGIFLSEQTGYIRNCSFNDNQTQRGAVYLFFCTDFEVTRCIFENNINSSGFGGAFYNWNCVNTMMDSCQFIGNSAANAGGMYIDGREDVGLGITIENSIFRENFTGGRGASIRGSNAEYIVRGCLFTNNAAPSSTAGGIHVSNDKVLIENCRFFGNSSGWGPAIANYNENTSAIIRNCEFESNQAVTSGGAVTNGFKARVSYDNCYFLGNTAQFGGAMYIQNDTTSVTVTNSEFSGNVASSSGGAFYNSNGTQPSFNNCQFIANQAEFGAGMSIFDSEFDLTQYELKNCVFNFNIAAQQGGAINIGNADGYIENCLLINNFADGTGTGAGMSINGSDSQAVNTLIMNSTIAENFGDLAAGIAQWTDGDAGSAELRLQNTIFQHTDGLNYAVEDGVPTVVSQGGNVCNEASLSDLLDHPTDIRMDPEFVDIANDDYHLMPSSPGVDGGVAAGAPPRDLDGNPRDSKPDAGCYEYQNPNGINWFADRAEKIMVAPNPARDQFTFEWPQGWQGTMVWMIVDMNGRYVRNGKLDIGQGQQEQIMYLDGINSGNYHLLLINSQGKAIGTFQKL